MKFFTFNFALFGASILGRTQAQADNGSLGIIGRQGNRPTGGISVMGRRYSDLLKIVKFYNPTFDERKYWTYGCHCLILGDRPMSDPGYGRPVDPLDVVCKQYKDCQKCVKMQFGEQCIGEMVKYKWRTSGSGVVCVDKPGTCKRNLCECDLDYAKKMPEQLGHFNSDYHLFWSTTGWDPRGDTGSCLKTTGVSEPECCGPPTGPLTIFNSLSKQCCDDHSIQPYGMCP
ncbi:unnamed protein product [Oikopleura dioica]|uniref:Phospholipase A2-like central domain-containing protein n=1 Tax=Oikopleura dioica TaxID=34765 RepID=E4YM82_OIKDI|nr:unnamed protein product [Oikopleura dioica]